MVTSANGSPVDRTVIYSRYSLRDYVEAESQNEQAAARGCVSGQAAQARSTPFVLDALGGLSPTTRQMFGCLAIYVGEKIVLILRDKPTQPSDNGVWLATTKDHHRSLRQDFPNMRSISVLGEEVTGWQILPANAEDFEESALRACEFILAADPRIGKVPGARKRSGSHPKRTKVAKKQSG